MCYIFNIGFTFQKPDQNNVVSLIRVFKPNVLIMEEGTPLLDIVNKLDTDANSVRVIAEKSANALRTMHRKVH